MKANPLPADSPTAPVPASLGEERAADLPLPTVIDVLHRIGTLNAQHIAAARFWATDYRIGVLGEDDPQFDQVSLGLSRRRLNGRMGSINRYRYIHEIIGNRYERILIATMINNMPMQELAYHTRQDAHDMARLITVLLDFLTRHYDAMPGHLWRG